MTTEPNSLMQKTNSQAGQMQGR